MKYCTYKPPADLAHVIRFYWSLEGEIPKGQEYYHRTLANHCPELIFHYGGKFEELIPGGRIEKTFITGIHGQTNRIRRFMATERYGILGVILHPYAIPFLLGISSTETRNQLIDLSSILGPRGRNLSEQILSAKNNHDRIEMINRFIKKQWRVYERLEMIKVVNHICEQNGKVDVKQLINHVFLSQRQFQRKFKELTGFSPKSFSRIVRFKSLVHDTSVSENSLTQLCYNFGYYDQSHFIKEFKSFSGYTPGTYFSGGAKDVFYSPSTAE